MIRLWGCREKKSSIVKKLGGLEAERRGYLSRVLGFLTRMVI
jgi:hypothetical protein